MAFRTRGNLRAGGLSFEASPFRFFLSNFMPYFRFFCDYQIVVRNGKSSNRFDSVRTTAGTEHSKILPKRHRQRVKKLKMDKSRRKISRECNKKKEGRVLRARGWDIWQNRQTVSGTLWCARMWTSGRSPLSGSSKGSRGTHLSAFLNKGEKSQKTTWRPLHHFVIRRG